MTITRSDANSGGAAVAVKVPRRTPTTALALLVLMLQPITWALERLPAQPLRAGIIELSTGMNVQQL